MLEYWIINDGAYPWVNLILLFSEVCSNLSNGGASDIVSFYLRMVFASLFVFVFICHCSHLIYIAISRRGCFTADYVLVIIVFYVPFCDIPELLMQEL